MKAIIVILLIAAVAFAAFNLHTCDYCESFFFGKAHSTETWGDLCDDCYRDFGGMEDVLGKDFVDRILG